jgi:exonuclease III
MFIVGSWNIWGLNGLQKQKTVHAWTQKNNLDIFGLLETKISAANLAAVQTSLAPSHWQFHSNITTSSTYRILIG